MANVIIYDKDASPKRVIKYLISVNTPDYSGRPDVLVNPVLPGGDIKYWKVVDSSVVEMTQEEKDAIDSAEAAALLSSQRVGAKSKLDGMVPEHLVLRAAMGIIKEEVNILRDLHSLAPRTLAQLKTAIKNKIDSGDVDE